MKKVKIIPIVRDNALSFEKYLSDFNLLKIEDTSYRVLGAVTENGEELHAVGAAVLRIENNSMAIESLIADETYEDYYLVLVKLLRHITAKAKLAYIDNIYCSYYYPDEEPLESALFEMGFGFPETVGVLVSITQDQISELCTKSNLTARNALNKQIRSWQLVPQNIKDLIMEKVSAKDITEIDEELSTVFFGDDGQEVLSYIIFDKYNDNVECREFFVKDDSADVAKKILNNVFLLASQKKDFNKIIIQSYDDPTVMVWIDYLECILDVADKQFTKNTVLNLSDQEDDELNETDQFIHDNVFGIEMLPRISALKDKLSESDISCEIDMKIENRPIVVIREPDFPTVLMRYTPMEVPNANDEYILEIYRYYFVPEDKSVSEIDDRLRQWVEHTQMTDAVFNEENGVVTFCIKIIEAEDLSETETILNTIDILNEDMDKFF